MIHRLFLAAILWVCVSTGFAATLQVTEFTEPLARAVISRYEAIHPGAIVVQRRQENHQRRALNASEIAFLDGPPSRDHKLIGHFSLSVIVNGRNPLENLDTERLRELFQSPASPKWEPLNGKSGTVTRLVGGLGSPNRLLFDRILGLAPANHPSGSFKEVTGNLSAILFTAIDPQTIGYVPTSLVRQAIKDGGRLRIVKLNGTAPDDEKNPIGAYPLSVPIALALPERPHAEILRFAQFIHSASGKAALEDAGITPATFVPGQQ